MRNLTAILGVGCALGVLGTIGCRHADRQHGHTPVSDPVGMMVVREHSSGKEGVFEAIDGDAKPLSPTKVVVAPTPTGSAKPTALPEKLTAKALPAENIFSPVAPAVKTPVVTAIPTAKVTTPVVTSAPLLFPPAAATKPTPAPVVEPTPQVVTDFTKGALPSLAGNSKAGHAPDFKWVVGELAYSHAKKEWRLRYAGLDSDDRYGGSVTLSGADQFADRMESGKLVHVEGEMLDKDAKTAPRFRVKALTPVAQ